MSLKYVGHDTKWSAVFEFNMHSNQPTHTAPYISTLADASLPIHFFDINSVFILAPDTSVPTKVPVKTTSSVKSE